MLNLKGSSALVTQDSCTVKQNNKTFLGDLSRSEKTSEIKQPLKESQISSMLVRGQQKNLYCMYA